MSGEENASSKNINGFGRCRKCNNLQPVFRVCLVCDRANKYFCVADDCWSILNAKTFCHPETPMWVCGFCTGEKSTNKKFSSPVSEEEAEKGIKREIEDEEVPVVNENELQNESKEDEVSNVKDEPIGVVLLMEDLQDVIKDFETVPKGTEEDNIEESFEKIAMEDFEIVPNQTEKEDNEESLDEIAMEDFEIVPNETEKEEIEEGLEKIAMEDFEIVPKETNEENIEEGSEKSVKEDFQFMVKGKKIEEIFGTSIKICKNVAVRGFCKIIDEEPPLVFYVEKNEEKKTFFRRFFF